MHSAQIVQQQNLTVSLSTAARLSALGGLATLTTTMYLYDHNHKKSNKRRPGLDSRNDVPLKLIQPRVNLSIIQRLRSLPNRLEQQRPGSSWVSTPKIFKTIRGVVLPFPLPRILPSQKMNELPLIVVVQCSRRIGSPTKWIFAFSIKRHLTDNELVLHLWLALTSQLTGSQD